MPTESCGSNWSCNGYTLNFSTNPGCLVQQSYSIGNACCVSNYSVNTTASFTVIKDVA